MKTITPLMVVGVSTKCGCCGWRGVLLSVVRFFVVRRWVLCRLCVGGVSVLWWVLVWCVYDMSRYCAGVCFMVGVLLYLYRPKFEG